MEKNFDPLAKERGEVLTRDMLVPGDMAPHSWQIKYLNNQAEFRLIVYLGNIGLRSKITHILKSVFTGEYLFLPFLFKGRDVSQWCVLTLLNYMILNLRFAIKIHVYTV